MNVALEALMLTGTFYWTVDLCLNFITGFYLNGELEMRPNRIRQYYLRHGFPPDTFLLSCDVSSLLANSLLDGSSSSVETMTLLRLVKLSRLLRMFALIRSTKLVKFIDKMKLSTLSENKAFVMKLLSFIAGIVFFNHLVCCAWYYLGNYALRNPDNNHLGSSWLETKIQGQMCHGDDECMIYATSTLFQYCI